MPAKPLLGVVATDSEAVSAGRFTQAFYRWYEKHDRFEDAVRDSAALFSAPLLTAMREDIRAQSRDSEDIVGLDWDPFLASQDPCPPYHVEQTYRRGDTIQASIRGTCQDRQRKDAPDVIAELVSSRGRWIFVNFRHGSDAGDLLKDLADLRAERDSTPRRQPR